MLVMVRVGPLLRWIWRKRRSREEQGLNCVVLRPVPLRVYVITLGRVVQVSSGVNVSYIG